MKIHISFQPDFQIVYICATFVLSFYLCMFLSFIFLPEHFEGLFFYTSLYLILLSENFLRTRAFSFIITVQSSSVGHLTLMQQFYLIYHSYFFNYPNNVLYNIFSPQDLIQDHVPHLVVFLVSLNLEQFCSLSLFFAFHDEG